MRKEIDQKVSDEFNAMPFEERKRVSRFMSYRRVTELECEKQRLTRRYRSHIREIDELLARIRDKLISE